MELANVRVMPSPLDAKRMRLVGDVVCDDRPGRVEPYWFDVAEELGGSLSRTGNPWLVCLVPLAASLGETLRIPLPVDRLLCRNVREVMAVWRSWYPNLRPVDIVADTGDGPPDPPGSRTGAFFSGGVDSFFTVLKNEDRAAGGLPVEELLCVHGFDISLENPEIFERHVAAMGAAARDLAKALMPVTTNLRQTRLRETPWASLWHGCALAAVGLALEGRYRRLLIGSTADYAHLEPWGSHPLTDPLLSTSRTQFLHDGAAFDRCQKLEFLSRFDGVLRSLHVCYRSGSEKNCGNCEKCIRNMLILETLGSLPRATGFPLGRLDPRKVSRVFLRERWQQETFEIIQRFAASRGRGDLAAAIDGSIRRSRLLRFLTSLLEWFDGRRGVWRLARQVKRLIVADAIV